MVAAVEEMSRREPPGDRVPAPPPTSCALYPRGSGEIRVDGIAGWAAGERRRLAITVTNTSRHRWQPSHVAPGGVMFELQLWEGARDLHRGRPWLSLPSPLDPGESRSYEVVLRRPRRACWFLVKPTIAMEDGNRPFGHWAYEIGYSGTEAEA
jgi:hypothetical protein